MSLNFDVNIAFGFDLWPGICCSVQKTADNTSVSRNTSIGSDWLQDGASEAPQALRVCRQFRSRENAHALQIITIHNPFATSSPLGQSTYTDSNVQCGHLDNYSHLQHIRINQLTLDVRPDAVSYPKPPSVVGIFQ
jgi:hypothetical protein